MTSLAEAPGLPVSRPLDAMPSARGLLASILLVLGVSAPGVAFAEDANGRAAETAAPATSPALVVLDSTRAFTVLEHRANDVIGWSLTLPFPSFTSTTQWEPVCVAPCALRLDPNGVYRVGGGGVASSGAFALPRSPDPLRLHVHAGSSFWHDGGIVLTALGVTSVIAGVAIVGVSTAETDPSGAFKAGVAFFVPGLVSMVVGAVLWITNGSNVVTEDGRSL